MTEMSGRDIHRLVQHHLSALQKGSQQWLEEAEIEVNEVRRQPSVARPDQQPALARFGGDRRAAKLLEQTASSSKADGDVCVLQALFE